MLLYAVWSKSIANGPEVRLALFEMLSSVSNFHSLAGLLYWLHGRGKHLHVGLPAQLHNSLMRYLPDSRISPQVCVPLRMGFNYYFVILAFVICVFMTHSPHISVVYSYIYRLIIHVFCLVMSCLQVISSRGVFL